MAYVGITNNGELIFKDKSGRFFVAGCYGKAAFNDMDIPITLIQKYEIEGIGTVTDKRTVKGKLIEIKNLKFEI